MMDRDFVVALVVGAVILAARPAAGDEPPDRDAPSAAVREQEQHRIRLVKRLSPSVVCIFDELRTGSGSGVIIDEEGYGLTNYHVVESMLPTRRGLVGLSDGRLQPMQILGADPTGDVALFQIAGGERYTAVPLGDSDQIAVGEPVLAFGNPFSLADDYTPTVTFGMVSGLHRFQPGVEGRLVYADCIQVDASINPGNSGGPLFDLDGNLIGINGRISIERRGQVNVGLGYAVPINQIKRFLPELRAGGECRHGQMGVTVAELAPGVAAIDTVAPDGAAWRAGIQLGDIPLTLDGVPTHSAHRFANRLGTYPAGWTVRLAYQRNGQRIEADVQLDPANLWETIVSKSPPAEVAVERPPEGAAVETANSVPNGPALIRHVLKLYGARAAWQQSYGSAVLISADGKAITTLSLLLEGTTLRAVAHDGREYPARVVRRDRARQLALLQMDSPAPDSTSFVAARLGVSAGLSPGDWLVLASNAFDLAPGSEPVSLAMALLSGRVELDARRGNQPFPFTGTVLLLDSISSNPGAAGGGVFDLNGNLVGLLGKTVTSNQTNTFANYALPTETLREFLMEAGREPGEPDRPVETTQSVSPRPGDTGMTMFDLGYRNRLVYVERVRTGSAADRAGIRSDDLIMAVNGRAVRDLDEYQKLVAGLSSGEQVELLVKRQEQLLTLTLTLDPMP